MAEGIDSKEKISSALAAEISDEDLQDIFDKCYLKNEKIVEAVSLQHSLPTINRADGTLMLPFNLRKQEPELAEIILGLAWKLRYKCIEFTSDVVCTIQQGNVEFFHGFHLGIFRPCFTRLNRSKKDLQQGQMFAFAMMLKGQFELLGITHALRSNNYFFGNAPEERVNKVPVPFGLRDEFVLKFTNKDVGNAIFHIFATMFSQIGLTELSSEDQKKTFTGWCRPFDDIVVKNYRSVKSVNKKGKYNERIQKAEMPSRSPLFLPGEMKILNELISGLWNRLDNYKNNYHDLILSLGFDEVNRSISQIYNDRYRILKRFADLSTSRLKRIRRICAKPELKKRDVSQSDVLALLKQYGDNVANYFINECKEITSPDWVKSVRKLALGKCLPNKEVNYLVKRITQVYIDSGVIVPQKLEDVSISMKDIDQYSLQVTKSVKEIEQVLQLAYRTLRNARLAQSLSWNLALNEVIRTAKSLRDLTEFKFESSIDLLKDAYSIFFEDESPDPEAMLNYLGIIVKKYKIFYSLDKSDIIKRYEEKVSIDDLLNLIKNLVGDLRAFIRDFKLRKT